MFLYLYAETFVFPDTVANHVKELDKLRSSLQTCQAEYQNMQVRDCPCELMGIVLVLMKYVALMKWLCCLRLSRNEFRSKILLSDGIFHFIPHDMLMPCDRIAVFDVNHRHDSCCRCTP